MENIAIYQIDGNLIYLEIDPVVVEARGMPIDIFAVKVPDSEVAD